MKTNYTRVLKVNFKVLADFIRELPAASGSAMRN